MSKGFTLLELLIVVVILGVLALIAAPTLLNAADKAKEGAVKANVSAGASTATTKLTVDGQNGEEAAASSVTSLQGQGTEDTADDPKSPFAGADCTAAAECPAYDDAAAAGVVTITEADGNENAVTITGYGKDGTTTLAVKTVSAPEESE